MASVADLVEPLVAGRAVPAELLEEARRLHEDGAVRLDAFGPLRVTAAVEDKGVCRVELASTHGTLSTRCECDGDGDGDASLCIHLLATAIETWHRSPKRRA